MKKGDEDLRLKSISDCKEVYIKRAIKAANADTKKKNKIISDLSCDFERIVRIRPYDRDSMCDLKRQVGEILQV